MRRVGVSPPSPRDTGLDASANPLAVVVPVAGRGGRFAEDPRFAVPKPIIDVAGRPMVWWALGSFEGLAIDSLVFVVQERHEEKFGLSAILLGAAEELRAAGRLSFVECSVAIEPTMPRGQLTSVLVAEEMLGATGSLLIGACDTLVNSRLAEDLAKARGRAAGVISVMKSDGDRWSFARLGLDGGVVEVREKQRISEHACTGLYYFADIGTFFAAANASVTRGIVQHGEHYVAPLYQDLIDRGARIELSHADSVFEMGNPAALDKFQSTLRHSLLG